MTYHHSGIIKLCMRSGEVVAEKRYECISARKYEIEVWEKKYKPAYYNCYYLICPNVDSEAVDDTGGNIYKRRKKNLEAA